MILSDTGYETGDVLPWKEFLVPIVLLPFYLKNKKNNSSSVM